MRLNAAANVESNNITACRRPASTQDILGTPECRREVMAKYAEEAVKTLRKTAFAVFSDVDGDDTARSTMRLPAFR